MQIDRLSLDLGALPAGMARPFAAALERELARQLPGTEAPGQIARLVLPPLAARPGESAEALARRTVAVIGAALIGARP